MLKTKTLFFIMTILSTMITICSNSWMSMWMGLEINLMSFIPLIKEKKSKKSSEAIMMYFLVQSVSSTTLLFSILLTMMHPNSEIFNMLVMMTLMMKMGAAPFHMWLPEMMSKMEWKSNILMMTWQKLGPLMMMSNMNPKGSMMTIMVMTCITVGAMGGLNQTSLRKIMAYSSINHLGWIMSVIKIQNNWLMYLLIYSMMIINICTMFNKYNMLFISQVNMMNLNSTEKITYVSSMLSLGGMPPFIGFLPKWIVIQDMMLNKMYLMLLIMLMMSMITLFYYMRVMSMTVMTNSMNSKWMHFKSNMKITNLNLIINFSLPMVMLIN
uniref:NADH-ubiquinone oxidoreductase chain 2 n=1 Tax=Aponsila sp. FS-2019 TaxID=2575685 RepID=A0A4D6X387_9HEMI|nr:NADH dehydrogenase subunit 2 [Aponsila sp. FS-2019]